MSFNQEVGKRIKIARLEANLSLRELGEKIELSEGNVQRYEAGKIKGVDVNLLKKIAKVLNCSDAYLMGWDDESDTNNIIDNTINIMQQLKKSQQQQVYDYASELLDTQTLLNEDNITYIAVPTVEKASAGVGYYYSQDNEVTTYYTDRTNLKRYDMATLITGDSMFPKYQDGDVALVQRGYDNVEGAVYIVDYDGQSFMKRLYNEGTRFKLVSINPEYEPIYIDVPVDEGVYFNVIGRVVDSFTPIEI